MRAAIFNPYLDTLGGGERYVMTVASALAKNGWDVDVEWGDGGIIEKLEERLGLNLAGIKVVKSVNNGRGYDLIFWLSDGSIPNLKARKNILHFQVPFHNVNGRSLFNRLKLRNVSYVVCNSKFTKKFIDREYGTRGLVVYPPVATDDFKPERKENIILSVGRFSQLLQAKRQDVLINAFKQMVDGGLKGWRLILAGGSDVGGREFVKRLKLETEAYPIEIIENPPFSKLKILYGKAKIFWSASGFDIDEEKEPEKVEHFGISLVEAMAAGCIPLVVNKGGFREIVDEPIENLLWVSQNALIEKTNELINDDKKRQALVNVVCQKANKFSQERFEHEILKIIT